MDDNVAQDNSRCGISLPWQ